MSAAKRLAAAALLLGVLGAASGFALAARSVPTPTITTKPANPTSSTSASFTFSDSQQNATYICSLDGSAYKACAGKTSQSYTGLAEGTHTFAVEAQNQNGTGSPSSPATYTWRIDLTPPSITTSFPTSGKAYNASGWSAGCASGAGVCGNATDPSGISAVTVSIRSSSGTYWTGSGFTATTEVYNAATLSSSANTSANWFYSLPLPSDSNYTVHVKATDKVGNQTTSPASTIFTIDTVPPPAPANNPTESSPTGSTGITFNLSDSETGVDYQCQLDGGGYSSCTSPKAYTALSVGNHSFSAKAVDAAGNVSAPSTTFAWQIVTVVPFGIEGDVPNPLYPGVAAQPIPLTLTNTMNVPITVTGLNVSVQSTGASGCQATWFAISQSNVSSAASLSVPANGSLVVPSANRPSLRMIDSGTAQDACKNAKLTLSYSGSAHS